MDQRLEESNFSGSKNLFKTSQYRNKQGASHLLKVIPYLDAVIEALEVYDTEKIDHSIEKAFSFFQKLSLGTETIKTCIINIIYHSIRIIKEMNGNSVLLLQKYRTIALDKKRNATIAELKAILKEFCTEYCLYFKELTEKKQHDISYQIEEYLKQNYQKNNITVKELSKQFYMHPAYLGRMFQKKIGISCNEYLHRLRIQEAQRLMDKDSVALHEIAEQVGYNNYHSFLAHFKRCVGIKPADYKNGVNQ